MDRILAAAEAALGDELTAVEELSRGRSLVLRARAGDRSVVLKSPLDPGPDRESAAAALADSPDFAPLPLAPAFG